MSNRLYETRALQRVSQYVIALKTGMQQSRISLIENELVTPKEVERSKIANALGVKVQDIFNMEEDDGNGR